MPVIRTTVGNNTLHENYQSLGKMPSSEGVRDGDIFMYSSFDQRKPNTPIFEGIKNLLFIDSNLGNIEAPEGCKHFRCQLAQYIVTPKGEGKPDIKVIGKSIIDSVSEAEYKAIVEPFRVQKRKNEAEAKKKYEEKKRKFAQMRKE